MALIEKVLDGVQGALRVNPNTLSGSVDILIVKHKDGTLKSTPFHVRFGKNQVIRRSRERLPIYISVNDVVAPFNMVMGDGGVAYFEVPVDETSDQIPLGDLKNPVPSPSTSPMLSSASPILTGSDPGSPISSPTLTRRRSRKGDGSANTTSPFPSSSSSSSSTIQSTTKMVPLAQAIGQYIKERDEKDSDDDDDDDDVDDVEVEYSDDDEYELDADDKADESFDWKWGELPEKVTSAEVDESNDSTENEYAETTTENIPLSNDVMLPVLTPVESGHNIDDDVIDFPAEMSLCAHLLSKNFESETDPEIVRRNRGIFKQHIITFSGYSSNPQVIYDPRIAIMVDGTIYGGKSGIELLVSLAVFHRKTPRHTIQQKSVEGNPQISLMAPEQQEELQQEYMLNEELARTKQSWVAWLWSWAKWSVMSPVKMLQGFFFFSTPAKKNAPKKAVTNYYSGPRCFRKSLRPSEEQLRMLNFHDGANKITFFIKIGKSGQIKSVRSSLYVVNEDAKIIISDIDGTITKSDALGHIFNFIGKDWSQSGVAQLYTRIHDNGYLILYLTSRAIGQAQSTRNYISSVRQSHNAYFGTYTLPPGPVFMSPFRLLNAIDKELLKRIPHEFKMACLADIMSLFPLRAKPFYAGFGNKDTDVKSYDFVGVDSSRIFIVNPRGIVHTNVHSPEATYISLNDTVDSIFPPIHTQ